MEPTIGSFGAWLSLGGVLASAPVKGHADAAAAAAGAAVDLARERMSTCCDSDATGPDWRPMNVNVILILVREYASLFYT